MGASDARLAPNMTVAGVKKMPYWMMAPRYAFQASSFFGNTAACKGHEETCIMHDQLQT